MTHASLFSGIGGFELAAKWAGWTNLFNCEIDPFCQKVLKHHFPDAEQYSDIKRTDFTLWRGRVDVLTGGFPCQPFSLAGKRKGTNDNRYLWPAMLRAIREISPRWVVGENVLGLVNWDGGMVFETVQADLETEGYEVQPYILPACGVGAPHQRYRTWFVAHRTDAWAEGMRKREDGIYAVDPSADSHIDDAGRCRHEEIGCPSVTVQDRKKERKWLRADLERVSEEGIASYPQGWDAEPTRNEHDSIPCWKHFPTQPPVCRRNDGISRRLDGITFPKWRKESIKAYGNAIVPQIVLQIFNSINQMT